MRTLEFFVMALTALAILSSATVAYSSSGPGRRWVAVLILLALPVAAHWTMEGYRWQMMPVYLATSGVVVALGWPRVATGRPWLAAVGLGLLTAGAFLCVALPVFALPAPNGPYPVASTTRLLRDASRPETHMGGPEARREVLVQIWYPAARGGHGQPYRPRAETTFATAQLALVTTHAATGIPVSGTSSRYPAILFSPSWPGRRAQNTVLAEELASRGFLVLGIDHPYGSASVAFPDGRVIRTVLGDFLGGSTVEAVQASYQQALDELERRAADVRFVLDELGRLDADDPEGLLTGRVDTGRVGIMGYSFGGAVAAEAALRDDRIQAVVNLDGMLFGESAARGITQPYFFITNHLPEAGGPPPTATAKTAEGFRADLDARDVLNQRHMLTSSGRALLQIGDATHLNFSDGPLFSPLQRWRSAGKIDPLRAMTIVNEHTVRFFRQHLSREGTDPGDIQASRYPEARFQAWPRPAGETSAVSAISPKNP